MGAPDWQGDKPWKSGNVFSTFTTVFPVGVTSTPVFATLAFAALQIKFVPSAGAGTFNVHWFADAAGLNEIGSDQWTVNSLFFLAVTLPCEGPFVSIHVNVTSAGPMTALSYAQFTNVPVPRPTYPISGNVDRLAMTSFPPSGTGQDTPNTYTKGHGHFRINPGDNSGKIVVDLDQVDEHGTTLIHLIHAAGFTAEVNYDFAYPDVQIYINVTNTDAGLAHSVEYALWVSHDD